MNNEIERELQALVLDESQAWVITYKGKRLKMSSGKQVWGSTGAARNAFAREFWYSKARKLGFKNGAEIRKYLEEKEIIKVERL